MRTIISKRAGVFLSVLLSLVMVLGVGGEILAETPPKPDLDPGSASHQAWLTNQVRHKLIMLPWYGVFDNLEFKLDGNNVTLLGQVVLPVTKEDAQSAVKSIEGVGEVNNQIEVLPVSPYDARIRRAEFRAIYSYAPLQMYRLGAIPSIHIIVNNGHVTLEGNVANTMDKNLAFLRANEVPGVFSVTNHLQVDSKG